MRVLDFGDLSDADFLARCTATRPRNPLLDAVHAGSAEVLLSVHRLVKASLARPTDDGAVKKTLDASGRVISSFTAAIRRPVSITYAQQTAFNRASVGRRMTVLLERPGRRAGQLAGRSPYMQAVHLEGAKRLLGRLVEVRIDEAHTNSLAGQMESAGSGVQAPLEAPPAGGPAAWHGAESAA